MSVGLVQECVEHAGVPLARSHGLAGGGEEAGGDQAGQGQLGAFVKVEFVTGLVHCCVTGLDPTGALALCATVGGGRVWGPHLPDWTESVSH